ncbi:MAG: SH3 domain-containing protein, partial [Gemmataceae bacterium]
MSAARTLLGTALALALAGPACAQGKPFPATVLTDGAEVRCKPGTQPAVYVTQRLPRGATVVVVEKLPDGWLKIDPPDGSFSWVNTGFLRQAGGTGNVWVVTETDKPVTALVGAWGRKERPDVVSTTLARGAQLIAVGAPIQESDGYWLPVMAPAGEYRYVR